MSAMYTAADFLRSSRQCVEVIIFFSHENFGFYRKVTGRKGSFVLDQSALIESQGYFPPVLCLSALIRLEDLLRKENIFYTCLYSASNKALTQAEKIYRKGI